MAKGWSRFTDDGRKVFVLAQEEAMRSGNNCVFTEHVLLALLRGQDNRACALLDDLQVSRAKIRSYTEKNAERGPGYDSSVDMELTPRVKRVIDFAWAETALLNDELTDTQHILLGLLKDDVCFAARVLHRYGVRLESCRDKVAERKALASAWPPPPTAPDS